MEKTETKAETAVEVDVKKGPELATQAAEPVAAPTATAPSAPAKKGGMGCFAKFMIVSCLGLLLCCCITVVTAMVAPGMLIQYIAGGNTGPDRTLTRITSSEIPVYYEQALNKQGVETSDGLVTIEFSEQEILALILESMKLNNTPDAFAVDFEPGSMKAQVDIGVFLQAVQESSAETQQSDFSGLKGTYAGFELGTSADGSTLEFKGFSLGNSVLDPIINSLLTEEIKTDISKSIQDSLSGGTTDPEAQASGIRKLEFLKDALSMSFESPVEIPEDEIRLFDDTNYEDYNWEDYELVQ